MTTNSNYHLSVAENLLIRNFQAEKPKEKMFSDISYVRTDEGRLYVSAINNLIEDYNIGLAMSTRMNKNLMIPALKDAQRRWRKPLLLRKYQKLLKAYGYCCSMSRKRSYWACPMESFWRQMKMDG